jgi:diaminopimelate decarboxylase
MVASNELDPEYFGETVEILLDAVRVIEKDSGITIEFVNLGGGFGLNYHPEETEFDVNHAGQAIREVIEKFEHPLQVFTECGRYVTGPHGYLLSKVRYVMHKYKTFIGLDASMHDLMRPGMFDAYHHMTILGAGERAESETYDVVGSLCENNDKFAINRLLPRAKVGDFLVIHDVGAHGHTMGFNYNGMLRSLEVLATATGELKLIRTAETIDDYLRNVVW